MRKVLCLILLSFVTQSIQSQSIAREWNEEVLNGIRNDFARPTVHARNLYHTSVAMYDAWAVFDAQANPFFLGRQIGDYFFSFDGFTPVESIDTARQKAISFAVYRIMKHRFVNSPRAENILPSIESLMDEKGFDVSNISVAYQNGDAAALGNYIAQQIIAYGLQDGANEANAYENTFYQPVNDELNTDIVGNDSMEFPNRWQPLKIENFVDQSGNSVPGGTPDFLSPEWGFVDPFSMTDDDLEVLNREGNDYWVYKNPGAPSYLQQDLGIDDPYKWGFAMVSVWSSHLGTDDGVLMDISPASLGNFDFDNLPATFEEYRDFYNYEAGGDPSTGRDLNPVTNQPYEAQMVLRGDYTRVLAEFWADGPDSETPPGHWFTILNYVNDQPGLVKKFKGEGEVLPDLEWDVKAYFTLGGVMHDCAIAAWSNKGFYDYTRPISAIRYMADQGQSTDVNAPRYHSEGIPLVPGYIELVDENDPLVGDFQENLDKIKVFAWRGPDFIIDPTFSIAGVDWILAEEWFPYQRASFVTPPFAGYVSGHSTYSRAAAEVLTAFTGTEYFPGGMGVFDIEQDTFLAFEVGPTQAMQLQWATYQDASDQTSLSRIWGGIHPPIDDVPGRKMGHDIGIQAFEFASRCFEGSTIDNATIFPNPATSEVTIQYNQTEALQLIIYDTLGRTVVSQVANFNKSSEMQVDLATLTPGVYFVRLLNLNEEPLFTKRLLKR